MTQRKLSGITAKVLVATLIISFICAALQRYLVFLFVWLVFFAFLVGIVLGRTED